MFLAGILAIGQVALAAAVTLLPTRSVLMGPLRTFTWTAALAVAALGLIPEAFEELGWLTAGLVLLALIVPMLLERISSPKRGGSGRIGLEVAFAGVLIHRVVDGVGLGAFAENLRADVLIALSAHAVAVESVVILKCRALLGAPSAWWRSMWLAVAGLVGVGLWSQVNTLQPDPTPFVAALTAGVLLHVAAHEVRHPASVREVSLWVHQIAAVLGVLITQLPGGHDEGPTFTPAYALLAGTIAVLPVLLITWRKRHPHHSSHP